MFTVILIFYYALLCLLILIMVLYTERLKQNEEDEAEKTLWEYLVVDPIDMLMDPNKKEREEEEKLKKEVKASKKAWRKIRDSRFKFLDTDLEHASMSTGQTSSEHKF